MPNLNVLGGELTVCSADPVTGFFRDGCCRTGGGDHGLHCICAVVTEDFLHFSRRQGNDLVTPRLDFDFPGLKLGDSWCLCVLRWIEALEDGCAPKVNLAATSVMALEFVDLEDLQKYAI